MPIEVLVKKSGLSRATVCRLLKGDHSKVTIPNLEALLKALAVEVTVNPVPASVAVKRQAERQARKVVEMVQGTMGLEAQAVDAEGVMALVESSCQRLLNGPRKKLWWE
jgi:hypothetical protein